MYVCGAPRGTLIISLTSEWQGFEQPGRVLVGQDKERKVYTRTDGCSREAYMMIDAGRSRPDSDDKSKQAKRSKVKMVAGRSNSSVNGHVRPVPAEPGELLLDSLRQLRSLNDRVHRGLGGEHRVEVGDVLHYIVMCV